MSAPIHLHLVSDSTGETLESVAKAGLARFEGVSAIKHFWPMVRSEGHLDRVVEEIARRPGLVLYTLVNGGVRDRLEARCATMGLPLVSALDPTIDALSRLLGQAATTRPGRQHLMDEAYFQRVDAINYTMAHDDGQAQDDWDDADIMLIGVSRSSKTPTSIYLANRGYKTANIPLVPQSPPPPSLFRLTRPLIVGLTTSPDRLIAIRRNRLLTMGTGGGDRLCRHGGRHRRGGVRAAAVRRPRRAGDRRHPPLDRGDRGGDHQSGAGARRRRGQGPVTAPVPASRRAADAAAEPAGAMIGMPVAGVIGWPVAHSKSPRIHLFWLAKLGIDGDYSRFAVPPGRLGAAIRALPALGLRGVNVTVPHKVAVIAHLDRLDPAAARVGAVNTVIVEDGRLVGCNTDLAGFGDPLRDVVLAGKPAVLVGAGGAARAALAVLADRGCARIHIINRTPANAAAMARDLGVAPLVTVGGFDAPLPDAALVVNASTLGMAGQPPRDLDLTALPGDTTVYDMVYAPLETPLLAAARSRGLATIDGLSMLIGQAAAAFEIFYGAPAPRQHDAELRAVLTA